jgi:endogenous inhibitor of DNA gyrase (YacG/DUF329 family)
MVRHQDTLWCDGCGIEINWEPIEKDHLFFCCQRCLEGEECDCGVDEDEYLSADQPFNFDQSSHF